MDLLINDIEKWKCLYEIDPVSARSPLKPLVIEEVFRAAEARFVLARKILISIERLRRDGSLSKEEAGAKRKEVSSEYHNDIKLLINRAVNYYIEEVE